MKRSRWLLVLAPLLLAAWPDTYPSRRAAIAALRYDLISPEMQHDPQEVALRYKASCKSGFGMACAWESWQTPEGGGDLAKAGQVLARRCSAEPLACVVDAWALSRVEGVISPAAPNPTAAAQKLEKTCKRELYAPACTSLGELVLAGVGVPQDAVRGEALLTEGCDAQDWWGCHQLGRLRWAAGNTAGAVALFEAACSHDIPQSCTALADALFAGEGVGKDIARAATLYGESCSDRHTQSCATLAGLYARGVGVPQSAIAAVGLYQTACNAGDVRSCHDLATLYAEGSGVQVDADAAITLLDAACAARYAPSCSAMGTLYLEGRLVDRDPEEGLRLLRTGCDGGDLLGCVSLGRLHEAGTGVARDLDYAATVYAQACEASLGVGCTAWGRLAEGAAVPEPEKALMLYMRGCQQGDAEGCRQLAGRYVRGEGVDRDPARAVALLQQGCTGKDAESCRLLGDAFAEGELAQARDAAQAEALYGQACALGSAPACLAVAPLLTDPQAALDAYTVACEAKLPMACEAMGPLQLSARFQRLLTGSLEGGCEVWGVDDENVDRSRILATVSGPQVTLRAGPHAGATLIVEPRAAEIVRKRKRVTAESRWGMRLIWEDLSLEVAIQEPVPPGEPAKTFPGDQSLSADPQGKTALIHSREAGTVWRAEEDRCRLIEGYPKLDAEGCSMTQALIAGHLLSECP